MMQAIQRLDYKGVFVYQNDAHLSTLRVIHAWYGGQAHERLVSQDGPRREVLIDGNTVTYVRPGEKSVVIMRRSKHPALPVTMSEDVWKSPYYRLRWGAVRRVAGMSCRTIVLQPRDTLRYARRICIDTAHDLPLETEVLNARGEVLERMLFTSLQTLQSVPAATFAPPVLTAGYTIKRLQDIHPATASGWHFSALPEGFKLLKVRNRGLGVNGQQVEQMLVSDGVSTVSVFIAPLMAPHRPALANAAHGYFMRNGALNVYSTTLANHEVTVIGEVPRQTIRDIVNGLSDQSHTR
ncbi:hypothetical protein BW247_09595 [Acidihalobacter ferrooxydans]|uniref:Transcriptional regulator n=2 Tax=Acidihalobacter ferrooxydans TaxID=1765967 RepID=A0A1P8UHL5_9GAMM|nr:hypothetical protein BW247_09595 [Acidihalobacter ferrooxydans]